MMIAGDHSHMQIDILQAGHQRLLARPIACPTSVPPQRETRYHYPRAILLSAASAARSPASQAPPIVPHNVSCTASPANQRRLRSGSASTLRADWPPGAAAENAP